MWLWSARRGFDSLLSPFGEDEKMIKIELRRLKLSDAEALREVAKDKEVTEKLEGFPYPYKLSDAKSYIEESENNPNKYEFAILSGGKLVGAIVLENPDESKKSYEVGYFVSKDNWGKGIATEALKEIVKLGFNKLKIERIWGGVDNDNKASARVLENAGFGLEKELKDSSIYGRIK